MSIVGCLFFSVLVMLGVFLGLCFVHRTIYLGTLLWSCCRFVEALCAFKVGDLSDVPLLVQCLVCWGFCDGIVFCPGSLFWLGWESALNLCAGVQPIVFLVCYILGLTGFWYVCFGMIGFHSGVCMTCQCGPLRGLCDCQDGGMHGVFVLVYFKFC